MVAGFKQRGSTKAAWSKGLIKGRRADPKEHWQKGIVAHQRWHHTDGCFIEYYCLARAMKMSSKEAYFAAIGGLAATNPQNNRQLNVGGRKNFTRLPDPKMIRYGKLLWGNNGPLNWYQANTSLMDPKGMPFNGIPGGKKPDGKKIFSKIIQ
jgi:hypothetical protein